MLGAFPLADALPADVQNDSSEEPIFVAPGGPTGDVDIEQVISPSP